MVEKVKKVRPPRGLARLGFCLPIWLYRLGHYYSDIPSGSIVFVFTTSWHCCWTR